MPDEMSDSVWYSLSLTRKVFYALGAFIIGSILFVALPVAVLFGVLSASGVGEETLRAILGPVVLIAGVAAAVPVYRFMRRDYEYVHSSEYAERNPRFVSNHPQT